MICVLNTNTYLAEIFVIYYFVRKGLINVGIMTKKKTTKNVIH